MAREKSMAESHFREITNGVTRRYLSRTQLYDFYSKQLRVCLASRNIHEETEHFSDYFEATYATRPKEWAAWARRLSLVSTNMYIEAFHKILKHGDYLQGKQNKRVDALIDVLIKLEKYYVEERVRKMEKGKLQRESRAFMPVIRKV